MATNENKDKSGLLYPELSYTITGILFLAHNELGRFAREKQYGDLISKKLKESNLKYKRELSIADSGNIVDFLINDLIALELKAVRQFIPDHYRQVQNYLQQSRIRLGILVNFRDKYLKPQRIIRID